MTPDEGRQLIQELCDEVYERYAGCSLEAVVHAFKRRGFSGEDDEHLRRFAQPISAGQRILL